MESWNNGKLERLENQAFLLSALPSFQYSNSKN